MRWRKLLVFAILAPMVMFWSCRPALAVGSFCDSSGNPSNTPDPNFPRINTALGCIPVKMNDMVTWALPWLFGVLGGISFLLMVYGFILIATSGGDPKAVQGAWETVTSAVEGLVFAIFSLFILRLIMLNILHIPGVN